MIRYIDDVINTPSPAAAVPAPRPLDGERLARWVGNKECKAIDAYPDPKARELERGE